MLAKTHDRQGELDRLFAAANSADGSNRLDRASQDFVQLTAASDLKMTKTDWLWLHWLAAGKFHVFGGPPGVAKTTIAMSIGATITTGGTWPDGTRCATPGNVLIWSGEDDPSDTLGPRLKAAGANLERVHFVTGVVSAGATEPFDPARDMVQLAQRAQTFGNVKLLIIDPIVSAVGGDGNRNNEVRRALQPVVDFAHSIGAAVIGITHFNKGSQNSDPLARMNGSVAYGALARIAWGAAKCQAGDDNLDSNRRVFVRVKSNLGPDDGGLAYSLQMADIGGGIEASKIVWHGSLEGSARDILSDAEGDPATGERANSGVDDFVKATLSDGPIPAKDFERESRGAGYQWHTVQRAARKLGAASKKAGMTGAWRWGFFDSPKSTDSPEGDEGDYKESVLSSSPSSPSMSTSERWRVNTEDKQRAEDAEIL